MPNHVYAHISVEELLNKFKEDEKMKKLKELQNRYRELG